MRNRTLTITVRVTSEEKNRLVNSAKLCGLSVSDYLRRLGFEKKVAPIQSRKDYLVFRRIEALKKEISSLPEKEIIHRLEQIQTEL